MNDEELDRCIANVFRVQTDGSNVLWARLQSLRQGHSAARNAKSKREARMMMGLRVASGLAATVALAAGLLVTPHVTRPVSAATSVRQALARINTWHLKGWKVQNGRQVPWEVWGRREPFFYREQVGGDIILDDGRQRLSIYGPSQERYQNAGVCVRHPSLQGADNVPWSYKQMILLWSDAVKPDKQTAKGPVFYVSGVGMEGYGEENTEHLCFVDGRTWLPTRYEERIIHSGHEATRHAVALLQAEYDRPLPMSASAAVSPPGYRVFDALAMPEGLPQKGAVTANGFTLECQPLAMDRDGNVLVRLRGWLGNTVVPYQTGAQTWANVHFQVNAQQWASLTTIDPPVNCDEQGRAYVGVGWYRLVEGNPDPNTYLMLFVPREPLGDGDPLPTTLTAKFNASVFAGWGGEHAVNLIREDMTLSVPLPEASSSIAETIGHYVDARHPRTINYGGYESLETVIYKARASQYGAIRDARKMDTPETHRNVYWMERAISAGGSMDVQRDRIALAETYRLLGEATQARRLLLDVLHEERFLKPLALPSDRSPASVAAAEEQVRQWNDQYFREARKMLRELDRVKRSANDKR